MSSEIKLAPLHVSLLQEAVRHGGQAYGATTNDRMALGKLRMYGYLDDSDVITSKGRQAVRDAG